MELDFGPTDLYDALHAEGYNSSEHSLQFSNRDKPRSRWGSKRRPWVPSEEEVLRTLAEHESWEEIGKRLGRPPGGVSQHWRKMQLDVRRGNKHRSKRKRDKALCES
jgi:DNA-binding CsgD family transcriptional regulator